MCKPAISAAAQHRILGEGGTVGQALRQAVAPCNWLLTTIHSLAIPLDAVEVGQVSGTAQAQAAGLKKSSFSLSPPQSPSPSVGGMPKSPG